MSKIRILFGILLLVLGLSLGPVGELSVSKVTPVSATVEYVTVYDGTWLSGCGESFDDSTMYYPDLRNYWKCGYSSWNDAIRSFNLGSGAQVTFYTDINYGGSSLTFVGPTNRGEMQSGFDRTISSMKVLPIAAPSP